MAKIPEPEAMLEFSESDPAIAMAQPSADRAHANR